MLPHAEIGELEDIKRVPYRLFDDMVDALFVFCIPFIVYPNLNGNFMKRNNQPLYSETLLVSYTVCVNHAIEKVVRSTRPSRKMERSTCATILIYIERIYIYAVFICLSFIVSYYAGIGWLDITVRYIQNTLQSYVTLRQQMRAPGTIAIIVQEVCVLDAKLTFPPAQSSSINADAEL